jgi:hypothetical protein
LAGLHFCFGDLPDWANLLSCFHSQGDRKVGGVETSQQLSRQAIDEFKAIYQEEFGQDISDDEARKIALPFLNLFRILLDEPSP